MSKNVLVILGDGFEEIEAVTPIDILRRAGLTVTVAGVDKKELTGSHGIKIVADRLLSDVGARHASPLQLPDAIVIPGGPGAEALGRSGIVKEWLKKMTAAHKTVAAICAAPGVVLARNGLLEGKKATSFPGYEKDIRDGGATFSTERVVTDGLVVTSRGAGTAMEFSLELVKNLVGPDAAAKVAQQVLAR